MFPCFFLKERGLLSTGLVLYSDQKELGRCYYSQITLCKNMDFFFINQMIGGFVHICFSCFSGEIKWRFLRRISQTIEKKSINLLSVSKKVVLLQPR